MLNHYRNHNNKNDYIEGKYEKNRSQECGKEYSDITNETAMKREEIYLESNLQSGLAYYPSDALRLISKFLSIASGIQIGTNGVTVKKLKLEVKENNLWITIAYPNI